MPVPRKVKESCPRCGDSSDVVMFAKAEGTITKECYTCKSCGCEWTEVK
ncbi:hypothetical protein HUG10_04600 [Halorarum halophilum]|uniref:Uncharacterized protein n=1 Tax=Halorarum halophilum TaxID=2743090 RepID=A0A7D5GJG6_9EURY|nr:hypothetical protein [Halobaculum halophilum]QLG26864.1 hypothetical protein HUG10_04600 [Halobaculum halophilum]